MNSIPVKDSPDIYIPRRTRRNQVLSYSEYRGVTDGSIFIQVYTYSSSSMYICRGLTGHMYSDEDSPKSSDRGLTGNGYVVVVCISVEDSPDIYIPTRTHQNQVTEQ
jgi:hypothetical protein